MTYVPASKPNFPLACRRLCRSRGRLASFILGPTSSIIPDIPIAVRSLFGRLKRLSKPGTKAGMEGARIDDASAVAAG